MAGEEPVAPDPSVLRVLLDAVLLEPESLSLLFQVWLLLHGGGPRPSRPLQRHPHHLPGQTGRTLLLGLWQHLTRQGLPAPVKMELREMFGCDEASIKHGLQNVSQPFLSFSR